MNSQACVIPPATAACNCPTTASCPASWSRPRPRDLGRPGRSGRPYGLLVTGPNITRAVEQGIGDTQYRMNSKMNPLEAGLEGMLDLDGADFVGRDALRAVREAGPGGRRSG